MQFFPTSWDDSSCTVSVQEHTTHYGARTFFQNPQPAPQNIGARHFDFSFANCFSSSNSSSWESFDSDTSPTESEYEPESESGQDMEDSEPECTEMVHVPIKSTNTDTKTTQIRSLARPTRRVGPGRPRAPRGSAADTPRNAQRRKRAQQRRREKRLEQDWRQAVASCDDEKAEMLYQELLPTVLGRKLFPSQTKTTRELASLKVLGDNLRQLNEDLGSSSKHRTHIASRVTTGLPPQFCQDVLGFDKAYLRKTRQRQHNRDTNELPALLSEGRNEACARVRWSPEFRAGIKSFFISRTEILSGANTHTRRLLMNKGRLEAEFHAHYPSMLRKIAEYDPEVVSDIKSMQILTALEKNILAAQYAAKQDGFSEAEEYRLRLEAVLQRRVENEVYQHLRKKGLVPEKKKRVPDTRVSLADFKVQGHNIGSLASATLWQLIRQSGIKYTCRLKPHSCPLHDKGPVWELQLNHVNKQIANFQGDDSLLSRLQKRQRELRKKVARYQSHLKQYERCREEVKRCEENLKFGDGTCVLYRDFVNCYNEAGQKVKNLVLVKITRGEDGDLVVEKLHNFCSDKNSGCDAYFVADVFQHHFSEGGSGFFDDIKHIILSGDHGPHFASIQTLWNESTFFNKYQKTIEPKFLCSYHAYNRCDGAGVCVKKEAEGAARNNCGPLSAGNFTTMMNSTNHSDTYAFTFASINRGKDVFPEKLRKMPGVRKFCDISYKHADENGDICAYTEGVVRARLVTGVGQYTVFDLIPRPKEWGRFCKKCAAVKQRPVYHKKENTQCLLTARAQAITVANRARRNLLVQPNPARISGPQVAQKRKAPAAAADANTSMLVKDIKAELLSLGTKATKFAKMRKPALFALLLEKRDAISKRARIEQREKQDYEEEQEPSAAAEKSAGENEQSSSEEEEPAANRTLRRSRRELSEEEQVQEEDDEEMGEYFLPYDVNADENFIEKGDPLILGWASGSGSATWSYAIAVEDFEGKGEQISVHHYSFHVRSQTLLPSWVTPSELSAYTTSETAPPPPELLSKSRPSGHVPYITHVDADDILLAGPATSTLEDGFLSQLQHASVRSFLSIPNKALCFGQKHKSPGCPRCCN